MPRRAARHRPSRPRCSWRRKRTTTAPANEAVARRRPLRRNPGQVRPPSDRGTIAGPERCRGSAPRTFRARSDPPRDAFGHCVRENARDGYRPASRGRASPVALQTRRRNSDRRCSIPRGRTLHRTCTRTNRFLHRPNLEAKQHRSVHTRGEARACRCRTPNRCPKTSRRSDGLRADSPAGKWAKGPTIGLSGPADSAPLAWLCGRLVARIPDRLVAGATRPTPRRWPAARRRPSPPQVRPPTLAVDPATMLPQ